ncbi:MAG: acyltransferase [Pedobacter sp.]|nr:MAG: acyltransferase [Pedobacter sp.]
MYSNNALLQSKPHFLNLDGFRGLVALIVVLFHFMEIIQSDFTKNPLAHGFLGVDFFFCLSGFVIAYAYDQRAVQLSIWDFIKLRLIRLHPFVVIGAILGLLSFIFDPFQNLYEQYGFTQTIIFFLNGLFLIPYPMMEERFFNLFSFNAPSWSLFWEYVSNLFYILIIYKFSKNMLSILAIIFGLSIFYIVYTHHNLLGGWNGETFWHGGARVAYSFTIGMLIFRRNWIIPNNLSFYAIGALLLGSFFTPYNETTNWILEPFIVLVYFPFIVALGAGSTRKAKQTKYINLAGELSYPLYMIHYPFIWIFLGYYMAHNPSSQELLMLVPASTIGLVLLAFISYRYLDKPIRNYFKIRLLNK